MTIWFSSDTHFGHQNIIKFCKRPFENTDEMNEALIANWNSCVKEEDDVYHLGDFAMKLKKNKVLDIIKRLNGRKHFIRGNHDQVMKGEIMDYFEFDRPYHELTAYDNYGVERRVVLFHYPQEAWNGSFHGSWHVYGHVHDQLDNRNLKRWDVGVDTNDYKPISLEQLGEIMKTKENNPL